MTSATCSRSADDRRRNEPANSAMNNRLMLVCGHSVRVLNQGPTVTNITTLGLEFGRVKWAVDDVTSAALNHPLLPHSSRQTQNLPFQQIFPTLDFFYLLDYLMIMGLDRTYHAHHFIFSFTF